MIPEELIKQAEEIACADSDQFATPVKFNIYFSNEKAIKLAKELGADERIVSVGTFLMDCQLGKAVSDGRIQDHIKMSAKRAEELLSNFKEVSEKEKENIVHCVLEHHGVRDFYSKEAEICCNADCYRFASVKGIVAGLNGFRNMEIDALVSLFKEKVEEKWNALSLDICKKELEPQYKVIKAFLDQYKG